MVALIPFRKDSKRIVDKNIRKFNREPLCEYTIRLALNVYQDIFDKVIVATDYDEKLIGNLAAIWNCDFYKRKNVTDEQPATHYIKEIIDYFHLVDEEDICLLQVTCPLRGVEDLIGAVRKYESQKSTYSTLVTVNKVKPVAKLYKSNGENLFSLSQDQDLNCEGWDKVHIYARNSSIYIFNVGFFKANGTIFDPNPNHYEMPWYRSIDIDDYEDFKFAEKLAKE